MYKVGIAGVSRGERFVSSFAPHPEMTVPGLVAHESALKGGAWLDVPQFEW